MSDLLLPGDHVPDEGTVGHVAEQHDNDDGTERGRAKDGKRHDGVSSKAILPDTKGHKQEYRNDQ